jgi:hypothetical protein
MARRNLSSFSNQSKVKHSKQRMTYSFDEIDSSENDSIDEIISPIISKKSDTGSSFFLYFLLLLEFVKGIVVQFDPRAI